MELVGNYIGVNLERLFICVLIILVNVSIIIGLIC